MNSMSSADFRKSYAKLIEVTSVTVNGHPIGTWHPVLTIDYVPAVVEQLVRAHTEGRPFTPVPKPSAKRR